MTRHDADESPDVVMGTLFIFGRKARSLIDSGATHSFLSHVFTTYADYMLEPLDSDLVITTHLGDSLLAYEVYKDCMIRVNDWELKANLIFLDIHDFDIMMGMDFLVANHASVELFRKEVVFKRPGEPENFFLVVNGEYYLHVSYMYLMLGDFLEKVVKLIWLM